MALVIPHDYKSSGINFLSNDADFMQVACMVHPAGHEILPHYHNHVERTIDYTCETLVIRDGTLHVDLYEELKPIHSFDLHSGDIITLYSGGHGFACVDDVDMVEIKQGPFVGPKDKTRFEKGEKE